MNEKTKDILIRAGKTFWQAALAYLLADAAVLQEALTDWSTGKQLLLSLAVGAAAVGSQAGACAWRSTSTGGRAANTGCAARSAHQ